MLQLSGYKIVIAEIEGFELLVPQSFLNATDDEISTHAGGCGPGKVGDYFVPDQFYGESIYLACQIHDWMYHKGKTIEDKKVADKIFLWNMVTLIDDGEVLDALRLRRAMTYYSAVSFGGDDAFGGGR